MKTLNLSIIAIATVFLFSTIFPIDAQNYGLPPSEQAAHTTALQQALDEYSTQKEKHAEEEKQAKDISDAIILASVGMPIAAGVSIGVLLFARKKK